MEYLIILTSLCCLLLILIIVMMLSKKTENVMEKLGPLIQKELRETRTELHTSLRENRTELADRMFQVSLKLEERLKMINEGINNNALLNRSEQAKSMKTFRDNFRQSIAEFNQIQKDKFDVMGLKQEELVKTTAEKLEKMRETVDEKLHKTLEERLGQSFKIVSERLEAVQNGLGQMEQLANGVGDLKKVLSNVKTRGIMGEVQLRNILTQILAPEQFEMNVKTNHRHQGTVEFAIKLPGQDQQEVVYLPIDAKFPQEDYLRMQDAYELGDITGVENANKALIRTVKKFAKEISEKYLDPPNTTDFGIMFLPVEGLYAEVVRQPDLLTFLQREYKIIVTGPTTLAAILNSLQMGFQTLAIQKRSGDIRETLSAVKTQFVKFGTVLKKAQDKIKQADVELENLVTTRTNVMLRKLNSVTKMPTVKSLKILDEINSEEE